LGLKPVKKRGGGTLEPLSSCRAYAAKWEVSTGSIVGSEGKNTFVGANIKIRIEWEG